MFVIGVKLVELPNPLLDALFLELYEVLNTEDDVLVELAEPTPFNRSPGAVSISSDIAALF